MSFAYAAQHADELSLESGQIMEVLGEWEDGWWIGKLGEMIGVFPNNFVEILEEASLPHAPKPVTLMVQTTVVSSSGLLTQAHAACYSYI